MRLMENLKQFFFSDRGFEAMGVYKATLQITSCFNDIGICSHI